MTLAEKDGNVVGYDYDSMSLKVHSFNISIHMQM